MDILSLCQKHKHSRPQSSSLLHIHIQCLQVAMYDTWRRIMRLSLLLRSLLTDNPTSPKKMGHTTGVNDPTLFEKWCGFFYVPQKPDKRKCCERGPRVFRPLARRLESLPLCRCHKKAALSSQLFKDPGPRFSKVPITFRARNKIFKSKYKEWKRGSWLANYSILFH